MHDREFSVSEAANLCGVDQGTLRNWIRSQLVRPKRFEECNRGQSPVFDAAGIFAIALLRTAKRRGLTLSYIQPIAEFCASLTVADLERAAAEDLILVSAGSSLAPSFRRQDEGAVNLSGFTELLFCAPVIVLWQLIIDGIEFQDRIAAQASN